MPLAARSVFIFGKRLLIFSRLLCVHEPSTNRTDELSSATQPKREGNEHWSSIWRPSDRQESLLAIRRVARIGSDQDLSVKKIFDHGRWQVVLRLILEAIAIVPVETID